MCCRAYVFLYTRIGRCHICSSIFQAALHCAKPWGGLVWRLYVWMVGSVYTHIFDVYFYVYICECYKCRHVYMSVCMHTHRYWHLIWLCSALKQTYLQQPIFLLISGFMLMFELEKARYPISTLHKYFNRSQRVRPILWKMKWQRFYNS